jgi:hypothetical protein
MTRLLKILKFSTILFLITIKSAPSFACRCDGESTVEVSVKYCAIVFKGNVISKTITSELYPYGVRISGDTTSSFFRWTKTPVAIFKIKADKIYKGLSQSDTISVITPTSGAGCGFEFQIGQQYIIYGTKNDEVLPGSSLKRFSTNNQTYWTNICNRTTQFFEAEEDDIIAIMTKLHTTGGLAIPRAEGTCALGGSTWPSGSPGGTSSGQLLVMWLGIYTFMGRRIGRAG